MFAPKEKAKEEKTFTVCAALVDQVVCVTNTCGKAARVSAGNM